ncbi:MAG TPA: homocysteine S-methyltransferase family protein [Steroidobacteraceae bacterium]|jgi:betaine-homocysteine S-methyltransferase|nr:homocysteine S-methyltransferase family protein [Steroidobacteraceae bacterium]
MTTSKQKTAARAAPGLLKRLAKGPVICAEGYVFELERRGYLQAGAFVPVVLAEHPEVVEELHLDFVRAGSDVTQALTYYVHREKLRVIGREKDLLSMNRTALRIAKKVARRTGTLFAGDICNTNIYDPADPKALKEVERIFAEQVGWAADAGVDYIVAETLSWVGEALMALAAIKKYSKVPAVVTFAIHREENVREGLSPAEACQRLEAAGADVVGINCHRGPKTMMPLLEQIRKTVKCTVAALPVPYRTTPDQPSFMSLTDPCCGNARAFPTGLDPFMCTRAEIAQFGREAYALGINYLGVCCGAGPHHIRALAEALGRHPESSKYSADMSKHAYFGTDKKIRKIQTEYRVKL